MKAATAKQKADASIASAGIPALIATNANGNMNATQVKEAVQAIAEYLRATISAKV